MPGSGDQAARVMGEPSTWVESRAVDSPLEANGARAVIGTDGAVWTANEAFCSLVRLDEPALRHLGWRQLVQHLRPPLRRGAPGRGARQRRRGCAELDVRLVPPEKQSVPSAASG